MRYGMRWTVLYLSAIFNIFTSILYTIKLVILDKNRPNSIFLRCFRLHKIRAWFNSEKLQFQLMKTILWFQMRCSNFRKKIAAALSVYIVYIKQTMTWFFIWQQRYNVLEFVYNGSNVYWRIARELLKWRNYSFLFPLFPVIFFLLWHSLRICVPWAFEGN